MKEKGTTWHARIKCLRISKSVSSMPQHRAACLSSLPLLNQDQPANSFPHGSRGLCHRESQIACTSYLCCFHHLPHSFNLKFKTHEMRWPHPSTWITWTTGLLRKFLSTGKKGFIELHVYLPQLIRLQGIKQRKSIFFIHKLPIPSQLGHQYKISLPSSTTTT